MLKITDAKLIFWDFDGVIKESVDIKTRAFELLFIEYGQEVTNKVRRHHLENGGMSRFEKFPIYLRWANETVSDETVKRFCDKFNHMVVDGVINAPWVPGAEDYLRQNKYEQQFYLVSATPQREMEKILTALDLDKSFARVYGAPVKKSEAIRTTLAEQQVDKNQCLMIGDARADYEAARENEILFLFRRHATNKLIFAKEQVESVKDFTCV